MACDKNKILALTEKYKLFVVEDVSQAVDSYDKERSLDSIGLLA